jgi:hypothetical protein
MAKRQPAAPGPTMVRVTATAPHTYMSQAYEAGESYEVADVNVGSVVPKYAMRADVSAPRRATRATVEEDADAIATPTRRRSMAGRTRTAGAKKKAQKSRR